MNINLRKFKIRHRTFILLLISLSLCSIIIFQAARLISQSVIKDFMLNYVELNQTQVESSIKLFMDKINMMSVNLLVNKNIYSIVNDTSISTKEKGYKIREILKNQNINWEATGDIFIVSESGKVYHYNDDVSIEFADKKFIEKIKNTNIPVWGEIKKDEKGKCYIPLGRKYRNFYTQQKLGYLIVYISEDALYDIYKSMINDWGFSYIVSNDSYVISHPDKSKVGTVIFNPDEIKSDDNKKFKVTTYNNKPAIISNYKLDSIENLGANYNLINIIYNAKLFNELNSINRYALILQIIIVIIAIVISFNVSHHIIVPLTKLNKKLKKFGKDGTDVRLFQEPNDELAALEKSFNDMVIRINDLIKSNNEEKEKQREMELIALQAQINPHFLYNTLDAIGWIAKIKKEKEIEKLVIALATFFRMSLHKGDKYITVREELELIKSFVTIQQMRFPDKFEIEYDVPEDIIDYKILKIILQPLVENAIKHGIGEKEGKGHIIVKGYKEQSNLVFQVVDDGVGFDIEKISNKKDNEHYNGGGYGILNVDERIKLEYGKEYGINIESKIGKGTTAVAVVKIVNFSYAN